VVAIIRRREPAATRDLAGQAAASVQRLRPMHRKKPPVVAEAIDWVHALSLLGVGELDGAATGQTLGSVLKYREDLDVVADRGVDWVAGV
jgi:hypothetical protein